MKAYTNKDAFLLAEFKSWILNIKDIDIKHAVNEIEGSSFDLQIKKDLLFLLSQHTDTSYVEYIFLYSYTLSRCRIRRSVSIFNSSCKLSRRQDRGIRIYENK